MLDDPSRSKNYKAYVNLGSVGPDLYYYAKATTSIKDMVKEGFVQAKGVTPWSYHLHSYRPNEFPLMLVEIIFSDAIRKKGKIDLYMSHYSKEFIAQGKNWDQWRVYEKRLSEKYGDIDIKIDNLKVLREDGIVLAKFDQTYNTSRFFNIGEERLYLEKKARMEDNR